MKIISPNKALAGFVIVVFPGQFFSYIPLLICLDYLHVITIL